MTDTPEPNAATFGLVMPSVVTASHGGPYNDQAFCAGYEAGWLDAMLATARPLGVTVTRYVYPQLVPQLDLLAMRHHYTLTTEPWDDYPDEWTLATFEPAATPEAT